MSDNATTYEARHHNSKTPNTYTKHYKQIAYIQSMIELERDWAREDARKPRGKGVRVGGYI